MKKALSMLLCIILAIVPIYGVTESEVLCQLDDFSMNFIVMMTTLGKSDMMKSMTVNNGATGDQRIMMLSDQLACTVNLGDGLDVNEVSVIMSAPNGGADLEAFFTVVCSASYALYGEGCDLGSLSENLYNAMITDAKESNLGVRYSTLALEDGVYAFFAIYGQIGYAIASFTRTDRTETAETDANNLIMIALAGYLQ